MRMKTVNARLVQELSVLLEYFIKYTFFEVVFLYNTENRTSISCCVLELFKNQESVKGGFEFKAVVLKRLSEFIVCW
jgi:hypothetical protein